MEKGQGLLVGTFLSIIVLVGFVKKDLNGSIRGRVVPYNAALHVWAVSEKDTMSAVVQNGSFEIKNLTPGRYRVIAEGLRPYKVTTKPDILVNPGTSTDIGDIILDQ